MKIPKDTLDKAKLGDLARRWFWSPSQFAADIVPWGMQETPYADWKRPHKWCIEVLAELERILKARYEANPDADRIVTGPIGVLMSSGHGTGKTTFMIPILVMWALVTRPFSKGMMTASSMDQLKVRAWGETRNLVNSSPFLSNRFDVTDSYIAERSLKVQRGMDPAWGIVPMCPAPERNERLFGVHSSSCTICAFEEAEGVPDANYQAFDGTLMGSQDPFPFHIAAGNPVKHHGWFAESVQGFTRYRHRWDIVKKIDVRTLDIQTPADLARIAREIEEHGGEESDWCRARIRGLVPKTTALQFIPEPTLRAAQDRTRMMLEDEFQYGPLRNAPVQMAVDLARGGDNFTVVMFRCGNDAASFRIERKQGRVLNPQTTVQLIKAMMDREHDMPDGSRRRAEFCYVDITGTSQEVTYELHRLGYRNVIGLNMGGASPDPACVNLRAYLWKRALAWLEQGGMLPLGEEGERLVQELMLPEYEFTKQGARLQIEDKASITKRNNGKSPDMADTFVMLCEKPPRAREKAYRDRFNAGGPRERRRGLKRLLVGGINSWR